jgi:hypothetical protein
MKSLKHLILESLSAEITYHGDDHGTKAITAKNMWLGGYSQEGIGIYFGPKEIAEGYGKYISGAEVNPERYIESRSIAIDTLGYDNIHRILQALHAADPENMYYLVTDYGFDVGEIEDVEDFNIESMVEILGNNEIRNFQIELVQRFDIQKFVDIWNQEVPEIHGLKHTELDFYIVINYNVKVKPLNF